LGDAAGQAGALGDPKAIFPAIDENLSHTFIMPDSDGSGRNPMAALGLDIVQRFTCLSGC
jgi:hypothetical protein